MKFQRLSSFFSRGKPARDSANTPSPAPASSQSNAVATLKSRGNELLDAGKPAEAVACYQQVVDITPQDGGAHVALGYAQLEASQLEAAQQTFLNALAMDPQLADAHFFLGQLLVRQNLPKQALQRFKTALALKPDFDFAWCELAQVHLSLADLEAALNSYNKALAVSPALADASIGKVKVLLGLERWQDALDTAASTSLRDEHHMLRVYQALALQRLKRSEEALLLIDNALNQQPDSVEALQVKGTVLAAMGQHTAALPVYLRAIDLDPQFASALSDAGAIYAKNGDFDQAVALYARAISAQPGHADALYNYSTAYLHKGRCQDAIAMANTGLAYHPDHADMHWVKAAALLRSGEFDAGWAEYEWRWRAKLLGSNRAQPQYAQPMWTGQPVDGKTIWVQAEQGLGDTIQLLRYVPLLAAKGVKVLLSVQAPIVPLCQSLSQYCTLLLPGEPAPEFDFHCPMFSLPLAFKTNLATIPSQVPYLLCDADLHRAWEAKLGPRTAPRVGLVWSGNPAFQNDEKRSVPLATLLEHLPSNCHYVCLQKEVRESDQEVLALSTIYNASAELHSFADTAALIACMDLVISVDTSVAHLAGALAKPVWIMLPHSPDWRWLMDREDSPWYSTARLFRQKTNGCWLDVQTRIGAELQRLPWQQKPASK